MGEVRSLPLGQPRNPKRKIHTLKRIILGLAIVIGGAWPALALSPPTITKTFGAASIPLNRTTTLNLTVTNPNAPGNTLTGVGFTDTLPAGLTVSTPNGLITSCQGSGETITATAGGGLISLTGMTLGGNGSTCTVVVNVTGTTTGVKNNTTSVVTSNEGGNGTAASASLTVTALSAPTITKTFGAASIPLNGTTTLNLTVANPNGPGSTLTGVGFTDTLPAGLTVSTPNGLIASCQGSGETITATAGGGLISLTGMTLPGGSDTCTVVVNVTGTTAGVKNNTTSAVTSNEGGNGAPASASITVGSQSGSSTTLVSSLNPSQVGQAVTFTASVTSGGGTPTGSVSFSDGATVLGTAALSSGMATFTTSALTLGSHTITASYGGTAAFLPSVSPALIQAVNTPSDSIKLRTLQVLVTPLEAQVSGQVISGAINSAITEGFSETGTLVTPNGGGVRFNFAADPDGATPARGAAQSIDPFSSVGGPLDAGARPSAPTKSFTSRADDAFGALAYAGVTKAPPRIVEPREWLAWAEVRGAVLDRWGSSLATPGASVLYGNQVNLLAGLTRKLTPDFLIGALGGYETFDYRSDALQGRLKGDGWTVGSYLGWRLTRDIRFDAGVAYSGIGYDGTAGTAAGSFSGSRWLVTGGLTGNYVANGILIEPSARIYALWEHENAYTDTLSTQQGARDFATGRASGGVQFSYPVRWSPGVTIAPYAGLYGDYYFNSDNADAVAIVGIPSVIVLDGWSARAAGGVAARFGNGGQISIGGERGGIGGNAGIWTYRARASVAFGAQ